LRFSIFGFVISIERKKTLTRKATEQKKKIAQEKVRRAVEELKREGKEITPYSVSKRAGVSYHTAKKYLNYCKTNDLQ